MVGWTSQTANPSTPAGKEMREHEFGTALPLDSTQPAIYVSDFVDGILPCLSTPIHYLMLCCEIGKAT